MDLLLTRYALERLLHRLSLSPHREHFGLKGAMLLVTWFDEPHRATRDVDLLGFGDASEDALLTTFREIMAIEADEGGTSLGVMAGLAFLGSALLGVSGTLGGHLVGIYTEVSDLLRLLGWEVYTTYYVPNTTLIALGMISLVLLVMAFLNRKAI